MNIQVGKTYTVDEIKQHMTAQDAEELKFKGCVLRYSPFEQTITIVPWHKADMYYVDADNDKNWEHVHRGSPVHRSINEGRTWKSPNFEIAPHVRRTPQQRLQSLMDRLVDDCKKHGTVPGVAHPMIQTIVGEAWKYGQTEVTGEFIRKVAQYFMEKANAAQRESDWKKIVSDPGADRVPEIKIAK